MSYLIGIVRVFFYSIIIRTIFNENTLVICEINLLSQNEKKNIKWKYLSEIWNKSSVELSFKKIKMKNFNCKSKTKYIFDD